MHAQISQETVEALMDAEPGSVSDVFNIVFKEAFAKQDACIVIAAPYSAAPAPFGKPVLEHCMSATPQNTADTLKCTPVCVASYARCMLTPFPFRPTVWWSDASISIFASCKFFAVLMNLFFQLSYLCRWWPSAVNRTVCSFPVLPVGPDPQRTRACRC